MTRVPLGVLVLATTVLSCTRSNTVELEYLGVRILTPGADPGTEPLGALGFTCAEAGGGPRTPLAERLVIAGQGCLVLDVYETDAGSACRTFAFTTDPLDRLGRYAQPITPDQVSACASPDSRTLAACVLGAIAGTTATTDAPAGPVVLRSVLLAGACPTALDLPNMDLSTTLPTTLVGCAYSCPVTLDDISGNVPLYLPVDASFCSVGDAELDDCMRNIAPLPRGH